MSPVQHVIHTTRCAHHYVGGFSLELLNFTTEVGPADTGVAGRSHVVTQRQNYLLDLGRGKGDKISARRGTNTQTRTCQLRTVEELLKSDQ